MGVGNGGKEGLPLDFEILYLVVIFVVENVFLLVSSW